MFLLSEKSSPVRVCIRFYTLFSSPNQVEEEALILRSPLYVPLPSTSLFPEGVSLCTCAVMLFWQALKKVRYQSCAKE